MPLKTNPNATLTASRLVIKNIAFGEHSFLSVLKELYYDTFLSIRSKYLLRYLLTFKLYIIHWVRGISRMGLAYQSVR